MSEHPIIFSGPMVRAILEGRKTQTRRVVKHIPALGEPDGWCQRCNTAVFAAIAGDYRDYCPSGVGTRLWVREAWRAPVAFDAMSPKSIAGKCLDAGYLKPWAPIKYEADGRSTNPHLLKDFGGAWGKIRVSIHMPRWASRITLEITDVRVQRVQEISGPDCIAEGVDRRARLGDGVPMEGDIWKDTKADYRELWDSINGTKYPWADNPWVWARTFKLIAE